MKKIGEYIFDYLKGLGEDYVTSFFEHYADKLKDWVVDKVENLDPKEIAEKAKDIKNKIMSNFDKKIEEKPNFEKDTIFTKYNKKFVKDMIEDIFREEEINKEIANKYKNDLENFKINKNNTINILLKGEENEDVKIFLEMLNEAFVFEKINKNEYNINIEFITNLTNNIKIKIIECNEKSEIKADDNINFIWYIIDEKIRRIVTKDNNLKILLETKPIIYIGYKDKVQVEKKHNFSASIFSDENFDKIKYHIMDSFILENNKTNEVNKKIFMKLIKKSLLFLLITKYKIEIQDIINIIYDSILPRMRFLFGNNIKNLQIFNCQITPIVFKKLLLKEKLSNSIKQKYTKLLGEYQKYLEREQQNFFNEFLSNKEDLYRKEKDNIKKNICENMILFINKKIYEDDNENEKENSPKNEKEKKKEKQKQNKKMAKVNSVSGDDSNKQIRIKFDDYLLKNSSIFINELIAKTISKKKRELYQNEIIQYYFDIYNNDEIISEEKK